MMRLLIIISIISVGGLLSSGASAADTKAPPVKKPAVRAADQKAPPAKKPAASAVSTEKTAENNVAATAAPQGKTPVKYTGMANKRDPFELPPALAKLLERPKELKAGEKLAGVSLPKVVIQGIIWNPQMPQLIVNNAVMRVGDFIEQFEIKEITKNSMILFFEGMEYEMRMQGSAAPGIDRAQTIRRKQ